MSKYEIDLSCLPFKRNVKRLKKKFPNCGKDIEAIFLQLEEEAPLGTPIPLINAPVYKVRAATPTSQKGKEADID